jgi:hypothetical protein
MQMEKTIAFVKANLASWTVKLGILSAVLVGVSEVVPQLDAVVSSVWPAAKPWLVVGSMYLGRAIGLLAKVQAAAKALQGEVAT